MNIPISLPQPLNALFSEADRKGNTYCKTMDGLTLRVAINAGKVCTTMTATIMEGESVLKRMGPELANTEFGQKVYQSLKSCYAEVAEAV